MYKVRTPSSKKSDQSNSWPSISQTEFNERAERINIVLSKQMPEYIQSLRAFNIKDPEKGNLEEINHVNELIDNAVKQITQSFETLQYDRETMENQKFMSILCCNQSPINQQAWVSTKKQEILRAKKRNETVAPWIIRGCALLEDYFASKVDCFASDIPLIKHLTTCEEILKTFQAEIRRKYKYTWDIYEQQFYTRKNYDIIVKRGRLVEIVEHRIRKIKRLILASNCLYRPSSWQPEHKRGCKKLQEVLHNHGPIFIRGFEKPPTIYSESVYSPTSSTEISLLEYLFPSKKEVYTEAFCNFTSKKDPAFAPHEHLIITQVKPIESEHITADLDYFTDLESGTKSIKAIPSKKHRYITYYVGYQSTAEITLQGNDAKTYFIEYNELCEHIKPFGFISEETFTLQRGRGNGEKVQHFSYYRILNELGNTSESNKSEQSQQPTLKTSKKSAFTKSHKRSEQSDPNLPQSNIRERLQRPRLDEKSKQHGEHIESPAMKDEICITNENTDNETDKEYSTSTNTTPEKITRKFSKETHDTSDKYTHKSEVEKRNLSGLQSFGTSRNLSAMASSDNEETVRLRKKSQIAK
ncbi:MAG: hypothetical protein VX112_00480 [Pseudomonadota bacterium]|nr:hypothetical protein [Pseudomonadota bacterium]